MLSKITSEHGQITVGQQACRVGLPNDLSRGVLCGQGVVESPPQEVLRNDWLVLSEATKTIGNQIAQVRSFNNCRGFFVP